MPTPEEKVARKAANQARARKSMIRVFGTIGLILFLMIFGRFIWGPIGVNIHYSDGERKIKVVKIAYKGFFWKTWEAEGIIAPGQGIATTYIWDFSVDNQDPHKDELIEKIKEAFETGQVIKVNYDQRGGTVPWRSETGYFAKEIEFTQ